jgi:hypothetical protein
VPCLADQDAMRTAIEAFSKMKRVKKTTKQLEKRLVSIIEENTLLTKESSALFIASSVILVKGEIGTNNFKNLKLKAFGGEFKPEINYNFNENNFKSVIVSTWHF